MVIILVIIWQVFYDQNFKTFNTSKRRRVSEEISGEKDVKGRKRGEGRKKGGKSIKARRTRQRTGEDESGER